MKIKKSSIHYKLVSKVFDFPDHSLCIYFWQAVWSFFVLLTVVPISAMLIIILALIPIFNIFDTAFLPWAVTIGALEIIILFWILREVRKELYPKKERKPSIVGEYIRAKKEKICPRLIFED